MGGFRRDTESECIGVVLGHHLVGKSPQQPKEEIDRNAGAEHFRIDARRAQDEDQQARHEKR